jgi:hypothetical protein
LGYEVTCFGREMWATFSSPLIKVKMRNLMELLISQTSW